MAQGNPRGKPVSWLAVAIILLGFVLGGLGLILGPQWWLFWTGLGVAIAGGVLGAATGMMSDVH